MMKGCNIWTRLRVSFVSFGFDRSVGGFIGTLPDSAAGLLRLKCVLIHMAFKVMVSAFEPD